MSSSNPDNPYADLLPKGPEQVHVTSSAEPEEPSQKKRRTEKGPPDGTETTSAHISIENSAPPKSEPLAGETGDPKNKPVSIEEAVAKLKLHLSSPKKMDKVVSMVLQLVQQKMDTSNIQLFIDLWSDFHVVAETIPEKSYFNTLCQIFQCMYDEVTGDPIGIVSGDARYQISTCYLATSVRKNLNTDETIQFTKNCQFIKNSIDNIDADIQEVSELNRERLFRARQEAILNCMSSAYKIYKRPWAKPPVDILFRAAAFRRLSFEGSLLERLDALTTAITLDQRAAASNVGPHTIRTYDSIAHPLRQKNVGILR